MIAQKEHRIKQLEESLVSKKQEYEQAKARIDWTDFKPALDLIFSFQKGDSAESAIFVLAQCQAVLKPIKDLCNTIVHYEREAASLNKLTSSK